MPPFAAMGASSHTEAKPIFANPVRGFANRVAALPGLALYPATGAATILIATLVGAFGTDAMPLLQRLAFWTLLIAFHTMLWVCWFAWRVRQSKDWWPAVLIGLICVNLPLPIEIATALQIVGVRSPVAWVSSWIQSAGISLAISLVVATAVAAFRPLRSTAEPKGRLWRAGFRNLDDVAAIAAEDHYCRVSHANGASRLVHGRFSDLATEVGAVDGLIVRRGHWVAASAVRSIERDGRSWTLMIADGRAFRIAPSSVPELRKRGWLANGGAASTVAKPSAAS